MTPNETRNKQMKTKQIIKAAALTTTAYCGGQDNAAAKGGFQMADGTTKWWVATRRNDFRRTDELTDADDGITITREDMGNRLGVDKITATCPGAVATLL